MTDMAFLVDPADKNFVPLLGMGTDATSLEELRQQVYTHKGPVMRQASNEDSIVAYTLGEEEMLTKEDGTNFREHGGSVEIKGGATAAGIPASAELEASGKRSHTSYLRSSERVIVMRTYAFKKDTPSFPTELEKNLYKYVIEWLEIRQKIEKTDGKTDRNNYVERAEEYLSSLKEDESDQEKWQDFASAVDAYVREKEVTHYISSIALGIKELENVKKSKQGRKVKAGIDADVLGQAGAGVSVGVEESQDSMSTQAKSIGKVKHPAIIMVGLTDIDELVKSSSAKQITGGIIDIHQHHKRSCQWRGGKCFFCVFPVMQGFFSTKQYRPLAYITFHCCYHGNLSQDLQTVKVKQESKKIVVYTNKVVAMT